MEWHVADGSAAVGVAASRHVISIIRKKPDALISVATGSSPTGLYEELAARFRVEPALFDRVRWIQLDEWLELRRDDPGTCETCLRRYLIEPLRVPPERFCGWRSDASDPEGECDRMARWLGANGPIDLQILGLGLNGHVGLNEPASGLVSGPHVAVLSEASSRHPMLTECEIRPTRGMTLGMRDILESREILLLVSGEHKATQLRRFAVGEVSSWFPATMLRGHPALSVYCDRAAAALVPKVVIEPGDGPMDARDLGRLE